MTETSIKDQAGGLIPRALARFSGVAQRFVAAALFCVVLTLGWEVAAVRYGSALMPRAAYIWGDLRNLVISGEGLSQIAITLERMSTGLAVGFAGAILLALLAVRRRWFEAFIDPAIVIGLTVPGLVWSLLCVVWFGVSPMTATVAVALGVAPALTVNLIQGIRAVDAGWIEMAHVYRFPPLSVFFEVWLPAVVPFLLSNIRLGFSLAWKVIVLVEIFGLSNGVGYRLNSAFAAMDVSRMLAWTILFCLVMALIEYGLIQQLERRLLRWRRGAEV